MLGSDLDAARLADMLRERLRGNQDSPASGRSASSPRRAPSCRPRRCAAAYRNRARRSRGESRSCPALPAREPSPTLQTPFRSGCGPSVEQVSLVFSERRELRCALRPGRRGRRWTRGRQTRARSHASPSSSVTMISLIRRFADEGFAARSGSTFQCRRCLSCRPQDGHHARCARAAEVLRQTELVPRHLPLAGFAADLLRRRRRSAPRRWRRPDGLSLSGRRWC